MTTLLPADVRALLDLWPLIEARRAYAEKRLDCLWRLGYCARAVTEEGRAVAVVGGGFWPPIGEWRDAMPPPEQLERAARRGWAFALHGPDGITADVKSSAAFLRAVRVAVGDLEEG